jgi:hypothetical protein
VVEGQHVVSTRKLVGSDAEQQLLEEMIDRVKPPLPPEPELEGHHYLLSTPFRYPPLRHGSRFGTRAERGIWYGAEELPTAFAETAYYRLVFLEGTTADLPAVEVDVSAFTAPLASAAAVDLTAGCFARFEADISSPTAYAASQPLGGEMRAAGVEAFRYRSARDAGGGACLGVFTPRAFAARRPSAPRTWFCVATREAVELTERDVFRHRTLRFERRQFLVDGRLPAPAT